MTDVCEICACPIPCGCAYEMTQMRWATELAKELSDYQGLPISPLEVLDALGSCGLELVPGDEAAVEFWMLLASRVQKVEVEA
jgi:hypothetical protein